MTLQQTILPLLWDIKQKSKAALLEGCSCHERWKMTQEILKTTPLYTMQPHIKPFKPQSSNVNFTFQRRWPYLQTWTFKLFYLIHRNNFLLKLYELALLKKPKTLTHGKSIISVWIQRPSDRMTRKHLLYSCWSFL